MTDAPTPHLVDIVVDAENMIELTYRIWAEDSITCFVRARILPGRQWWTLTDARTMRRHAERVANMAGRTLKRGEKRWQIHGGPVTEWNYRYDLEPT